MNKSDRVLLVVLSLTFIALVVITLWFPTTETVTIDRTVTIEANEPPTVIHETEYVYQVIEKPMGVADQVEDVRGAVVHILNEGRVQGSGCIISEDGIIATAKHVVSQGTSYVVTLDDGRKYRTTQCAENKKYDIAFLQIDRKHPLPEVENAKLNRLISDPDKPLPYVHFADPCDMRVGDPLFVMGSPFGFDNFNSTTLGILSAKQRDLDKNNPYTPIGWSITFQSDAGVCPGNSGGPVFDINGGFVGVVVAGYRGAEVNYSVPVSVFDGDIDMVRQWFVIHKYQEPEPPQDQDMLMGLFKIITFPIRAIFGK